MKHAFNLFAALFLFAFALQAQEEKKEHPEPKFKKSKSYSKSYSLGGSDKVTLSNQFGEMKINTWDKNEVKVDVQITGKSDDEKRAQEILDRISIEDGKQSGGVYFRTKMESSNSDKSDKEKGHRNEGMKIDYVVYLPPGNALDASNQFGPLTIPDFRGPLEISSKFGTLTAGKLTNTKVVNVEFGKATIGQVSGGKLNIKFSEGSVNKITGEVKSDLDFSNVKLDLDNEVRSLDINNSYSSIYLDLEKNFSASWDIHTSHGEFSNKTSFAINEEGKEDNNRYGPRFNRNYKGISGSGASKITINSSFGEIIAGHDLKVDLSRKNKSGKRPNTRII